jgi:hypothetical protein
MATGGNTFNSLPHNTLTASAYVKYLQEVFMEQTKKVNDDAAMAFHTKTTDTLTSYAHTFAGIGSYNAWDGETPLAAQAFTPKNFITMTQVFYRTGLALTWKLLKYLQYREVITEAIAGLGVAGKYDMQTHAFSFLNTGFNADTTNPWYSVEAKAFFSATHGLSNGSTYSNLATGALSVTTLQNACVLLRKTPDEQGRIMGIQPRRLWVAPDQEFTAHEILAKGYRMKPDTANNTPNALNDLTSIEVKTCEHITSSTAWFLQGDEYKTILEVSQPLSQTQYKDDTIRGIVHEAIFAQQVGARSWRGWVGSTGL